MGLNDFGPQYDEQTQKTVGIISFVFIMLLSLIFIVLKVAAVGAIASWSWVWVLCPLWIPFLLGLVGMILGIKPPGQ